jgi:hypothetical protein
MKRFYTIAAALPLVAFAAAAQDSTPLQIKMLDVKGGVMGRTVKGAPYSATEVNDTSQTLADGTRIHNETQTQVWRDSEGRVRRETGSQIMIYDPVAGASYSINTKNQTARKLPLGTYLFTTTGDGSKTTSQYFRFSSSETSADVVKKELDTVQTKLATAHAEYSANHPDVKKTDQDMAEVKRNMETLTLEGQGMGMGVGAGMGGGFATARAGARAKGVVQSLGKRMIEGVNADGTSETSTIETGAIGNDRPIQSVNERWYSSDLQTVMMSRHSDPRTGEETFKLINVSRTEPPPYLFQIPAGYQVVQ